MKVIWYTQSYEAHTAAASPNTRSASLGCNSKLIYQINTFFLQQFALLQELDGCSLNLQLHENGGTQ